MQKKQKKKNTQKFIFYVVTLKNSFIFDNVPIKNDLIFYVHNYEMQKLYR